MGKHSAPARRPSRTTACTLTLAAAVAGTGLMAVPAQAAGTGLRLSGTQAPKRIDEPGKTHDVVRLPRVSGITWSLTDVEGEVTLTPCDPGDAKSCDVSVEDVAQVVVTATRTADAKTQTFPPMRFDKNKGLIRLTSSTSPRLVDKPGAADDGIVLPTVKGITWNVGESGPITMSNLTRGFWPSGGLKELTISATVDTDNYILQTDSDGLRWDFAFDTSVTNVSLTAPRVRDDGGIKTDAVILPHADNVKWYVNKRVISTSAARSGAVLTAGKEATVVATPNAGYAVTVVGTPTGCTDLSPLPSWAKAGSTAWTCTGTAATQQLTKADLDAATPVLGSDLGGTKNDTLKLTAVPGVKWQVTLPGSGVRTYIATSDKTVTLGYNAKSFGDPYKVTVKPIVISAADYSFAEGADAATELTLESKLSPVDLTNLVRKVTGSNTKIAIKGVKGVTSWRIQDNGKARTVRVPAGSTYQYGTYDNSKATVTPVFEYGYGQTTAQSIGDAITPAA